MPRLTPAQQDRAAGVLLGTAAGDALGAGYEFGPPLGESVPVVMDGGGPFDWEPGEWTDDASMASPIAQVAADGLDLRIMGAQDRIARAWFDWAKHAKDVGSQTSAVLSAAGRAGRASGVNHPTAAHLRQAARQHHDAVGQSGGNGSLMRTAPVALGYLDQPESALIDAATAISALTHFDPEAGEACALWCLAIRHAVLTGEVDVRGGLHHLPTLRHDVWVARLDEAESSTPATFNHNGWVVQALQGAWRAIVTKTGNTRPEHLRLGLEAAVRGGNDTDTVAAIAGGLLGAAHGASAIPDVWIQKLHGWPGIAASRLAELATEITTRASQQLPDDPRT